MVLTVQTRSVNMIFDRCRSRSRLHRSYWNMRPNFN